ncbi:MAG: hypothetical protein COS25_02335 [Candidatus Nealsonbacteria bacterium CG02_land_8_20_14_3_00_37_10]|uniref:Nucleotidyl transferase AbiEii/AbiGii toxin family protein n=2 Tax=Candidatus Nealsoniibacteriota TaxID=1817911 RepID=A0A2M7D982_9BACT|nr:MAG: hypothetical protein COS25_02335 [Candidatus Nealsonbacteria bacterium CG02_land_8_20_14_3_00_37_10]
MPEFYHRLITEKSFKILQSLLKKKFKFILIGGWAVFLYAKTLKSKDIDIVVDYDQLEEFRKKYDVFKNERLKKYEIKTGEVDIDIYLPYFSELGLKVEEIQKYCQSREGFAVPIPEILLILKIYTYQQRKSTNKGRKDLIDIFSLLRNGGIDWAKYKELIEKYGFKNLAAELKNLVCKQKAIPELNLFNHQIAKLKKETLEKI